MEVECNRLFSLVLFQRMEYLSFSFNNHDMGNSLQARLMEDETIHQNHNTMEIEDLGSPHSREEQEAKGNSQLFMSLDVLLSCFHCVSIC
jgi:hypothetical protein